VVVKRGCILSDRWKHLRDGSRDHWTKCAQLITNKLLNNAPLSRLEIATIALDNSLSCSLLSCSNLMPCFKSSSFIRKVIPINNPASADCGSATDSVQGVRRHTRCSQHWRGICNTAIVETTQANLKLPPRRRRVEKFELIMGKQAVYGSQVDHCPVCLIQMHG